MPSGWELAAYQANPVVLWAHDYDELPVARDTRTVVEGDRLMGHPQFPEPGLHPFADSVYALLMGGYLRGASVGFQPVEWTYDEGRQGYTITRAELYEWSIVPVPANPRCLIEARSKGIDVAPLRGWAERLLDAAEGPGFWVARSTLEATWRAVTPAATTVMVTPPSALSAPVAPADPSPSIGLAVCPQPPDDLIARAADPDPEVLVLEPDPEAEIDPADLSAALGALIGQAISEAVAEQMTALTGRIAG
jgi:HK97 family phage prohead protease